MVADSTHAREPKQARSRESFERVIDATLELLQERSFDQVTLADISRKAGVSTGSMYGRIDGKGSLLRVVQGRFYAGFNEESQALRLRVERLPPTLEAVVPAVVEGLGSLLQRHASVLRALMLQAVHDPEIAAAGSAFGGQNLGLFSALLWRCRAEIRHPEPERAIDSAIQILYASLARYLRLDTAGGFDFEDWGALNADLSDMVRAFLSFPGQRRNGAESAVRPASGVARTPKRRTATGRKTAR